jgi:hypothetical protein
MLSIILTGIGWYIIVYSIMKFTTILIEAVIKKKYMSYLAVVVSLFIGISILVIAELLNKGLL